MTGRGLRLTASINTWRGICAGRIRGCPGWTIKCQDMKWSLLAKPGVSAVCCYSSSKTAVPTTRHRRRHRSSLVMSTNFDDSLADRWIKQNNTVYIVEGANRDFVSVLGSHFSLHPSIFIMYYQGKHLSIQPRHGVRDGACIYAA